MGIETWLAFTAATAVLFATPAFANARALSLVASRARRLVASERVSSIASAAPLLAGAGIAEPSVRGSQ